MEEIDSEIEKLSKEFKTWSEKINRNIQFKEMIDNLGDLGSAASENFDSWVLEHGFPVKSIEFENGNPISNSTC